jgi:hypothetical protein
MPPNNPMTPQRMRRRWIVETLDDSNHVDWAPVMERLNVICEVNADQLERNAEREGKYGEYCTRNSGHDGPCNGLPRKDCVLPKPPEAK